MSSSTLILGGLTLEGFFDRGQALVTLIRNGQVVSRVPRELYLGCFALTVEVGGVHWTLETNAGFHSWRRAGEGFEEGSVLRGWLLRARGTRRQIRRQWLVGFAAGVVTYFVLGALLLPWFSIGEMAASSVFFFFFLATLEGYQTHRLRGHLDRQASLIVAV